MWNPVKEILTLARELYAENPDHTPYGEDPCGTCAVLALEGAWGDLYYPNGARHARHIGRENLDGAITILASCAGVIYEDGNRAYVINWNATNSTETVIAAFDQAILAS